MRVPTGAFVARRNGHVFITGNSGFPKSLDVVRSIDMALCPLDGRHFQNAPPPLEKRQAGDHVCPKSEASGLFLGSGTALKPAWEPVLIARKPTE